MISDAANEHIYTQNKAKIRENVPIWIHIQNELARVLSKCTE